MKEDPRLGLPSASSALENSLCPGRFNCQKTYAEMLGESEVEEESDLEDEGDVNTKSEGSEMDRDAEAGKRIHSIYAGENCAGASNAEVERGEQGRSVDGKMFLKWMELFRGLPEEPILELRETRWWLRGMEGQPLYSGQSDAVWIRGVIGGPADILLADLKGLWGHHDPAKFNQQIRHYVALIAGAITEYGFTEVLSAMAYLNQPAKTMDPQPVQYDKDDIRLAIEQMREEVSVITNPDAPRIPGPIQCRLCRGKMICAEWEQKQQALTVPFQLKPDESKPELRDRILALSGEKLAAFCDWAPVLKNLAESAVTEAKRRLAREEPVPGYRLKKNNPRERIVDCKLVFTRLQPLGVTADEFAAMVDLTKSSVEEVVRAKTGLKGRKLDEACWKLYQGAVMPTPIASSLEKING